MINYSVVISISGEVWGTWTLHNKLMPDERVSLGKMIRLTLNENGMENEPYHVDYIENIDCEGFTELLEGVNGSLNDEFGE